MPLLNIDKHETREFNYKPRFYDPNKEQQTGDKRQDFADQLHREWSSKRRHTDDKKHIPWLTIVTMLFFAIILAFICFKFIF